MIKNLPSAIEIWEKIEMYATIMSILYLINTEDQLGTMHVAQMTHAFT